MRLIHRLNPLLSRARPRFGLSVGYQHTAARSWQIAPEQEYESPAAIFEPADLEKITGVYELDTLEGEILKTTRHRKRHGATMAYEIRDAVLSQGNLFSRKTCYEVSGKRASLFAKGEMREYKDAVLSSTGLGIKYFGHWMLDDLPKTLAAYDMGQPISVLTDPSPAQRDYMRLLDLKPDVVADAYFERIVVIDDTGQNAHKLERYKRLHDRGPRDPSVPRPSGIMLLRGASGQRRVLTNENEVADIARRRGMTVIDPMAMSAEELIKLSAGVEFVLGVEGSQLTNSAMWMSMTGTMVTIQPPQRFTMIAKDRCDCVGMRYGFIIGDAVDEHDFHVDISALERLLDRAGAPA
jgi:Glycosyltransferase 61